MEMFGQNGYKRIYICLYPSPIQFNVKKIPVTEKTEMWQNGAKLK